MNIYISIKYFIKEGGGVMDQHLDIYNFFHMNLLAKHPSVYGSHPINELRTLYNNIVRLGRTSPLYIVKLSPDIMEYVIGIKEAAIYLKALSNFLSDKDQFYLEDVRITSDAPDIIDAELVNNDITSLPPKVEIHASCLARTQKNTGNMQLSGMVSIPPGNYFFMVTVGDSEWDIDFEVTAGSNILKVQKDLVQKINDLELGITAHVEEVRMRSRIVIESNNTGLDNSTDGLLFSFKDRSPALRGIISYFKCNHVEQYPCNSVFIVNGEEMEAATNVISLNHTLKVSFYSVSDTPIQIHYSPDIVRLKEKLKEFSNTYNALIDYTQNQMDSPRGASRLYNDITNIAYEYSDELALSGLKVEEDGHITIVDTVLLHDLQEGNGKDFLTNISEFRQDLLKRAEWLCINPMDYVDKTIVSYPNPARAYDNPYLTSNYSGMLYNYYL